MSDKVLTYLQGDSQGARRDLIAHCYYDAAQGDPKSGPVVFAVLLDACAEQFAKTPQELLGVVTEFRKLLAEGREMEARIRERVELSNFGVVSEFKDETRRVTDILREVTRVNLSIVDRAKRIDEKLEPTITRLERIGQDLYLLKDELKINRESAGCMTEQAVKMQGLHQDIHALMRGQSKEARANWITTGFLAGILLVAVSFHLPWWEGLILLVGAIGLLQGLSRLNWKFSWKKTK